MPCTWFPYFISLLTHKTLKDSVLRLAVASFLLISCSASCLVAPNTYINKSAICPAIPQGCWMISCWLGRIMDLQHTHTFTAIQFFPVLSDLQSSYTTCMMSHIQVFPKYSNYQNNTEPPLSSSHKTKVLRLQKCLSGHVCSLISIYQPCPTSNISIWFPCRRLHPLLAEGQQHARSW